MCKFSLFLWALICFKFLCGHFMGQINTQQTQTVSSFKNMIKFKNTISLIFLFTHNNRYIKVNHFFYLPIFYIFCLHNSMAFTTCPVFFWFFVHSSTLEMKHSWTHFTAYKNTFSMAFPAVVVILIVLKYYTKNNI